MRTASPVRSYARANKEMAAAFCRYLVAHGNAAPTIRAYDLAVSGLVDWLGSRSIGEVERSDIRQYLGWLYGKGVTAITIRLRTAALRAFFKFIRLAGLTKRDPTLLIAHRKIPHYVPRVLSITEVERLIGAARDPFERAVAEVLYATGCRVSELVRIRLEDIDFADGKIGSIRVQHGKGDKARVVLFGRKAAQAIREYQAWRPSQAGFLFEAPRRTGCLYLNHRRWNAAFYVNRVQRSISVGSLVDFPTAADARRQFECIAAKIPGFVPVAQRPYTSRAISNVINRLAHRAKLGRVHPHMLRRAFACHMLQGGANLRVIQDLMGHDFLRTTTLYTSLTAQDLKKVHRKFHPHERGGAHAKKD